MTSVLVIGLGRFGRHVLEKLINHRCQVMAVDNNEDRVQSIAELVDRTEIGDATDPNFIDTLGVDRFDVCIVCIGDNFQNSLEITDLLREKGAQKIISRAATDIQEKFLLKNGADEVVYPEKQLAAWTAMRCSSNHIFDYIELNDEYSIVEISVPEKWYGRAVNELDIRRKYGVNILAIKKSGNIDFFVMPDTTLSAEQTMLVLGKMSSIQKCFKI